MASWKKIVADGASLPDIGTPASTDMVLIQDATDGVIKYVEWSDVTSGGSSGITDIVQDTSPQLGGHLDTQNYRIEMSTNNIPIRGRTTSNASLEMMKVNASNEVQVGSQSSYVSIPTRAILGSNYHDTTNINTSTVGTYGVGADLTDFGSSTSVSAGRAYYLNSSGGWSLATPTTSAAQESLITIATGGVSTRGMCLRGFICVQVGTQSGSFTVGKPVFLASNGTITDVPPTGNGNYQRILGYAVASKIIFFDPSQEHIQL